MCLCSVLLKRQYMCVSGVFLLKRQYSGICTVPHKGTVLVYLYCAGSLKETVHVCLCTVQIPPNVCIINDEKHIHLEEN